MNEEEIVLKIKEIIDELRPYLIMDGGDIEFVKYEDHYLYVKMLGACQHCIYIDNTLDEMVFNFFKEHIPELEGVINVNL